MSLIKRFTILSLFCVLFSCKEKSFPLEKSREYFTEYLIVHNKSFLDSSYNSLTSGRYLDSNGLNETNKDIVLPLLTYMGKYQELESLLTANQDMKTLDKKLALNLIRSLDLYQKDSSRAKGLIRDNLQLISKEIEANPNDSLLWASHFTARIYLVGQQKTLEEIDSLKSIENRYSDIFYDNILKDLIQEYPDELMYKRK